MKLRELNSRWPAYRLVAAGWCTLGDLDAMTLDDVLDACDVLDEVERVRAIPKG